MTNREAAGDSDVGRDQRDEIDTSEEEDQPGVIASVGSGALGSVDVEPESKHRPDNDGETVPE